MPDGLPRTSPIDPRADLELVKAMRARDESALATLYDRHSAPILGFLLRLIPQRSDAESVLLDAFLQAWRTAERFDPARSEVLSWLLMMARSRALDALRASSRAQTLAPVSLDDAALSDADQMRSKADPEQHTHQREQDRAIRSALRALPVAQRDAIELAFYLGLTHPEIAERLGEPLGTIKSRIRGGLLKLRESLRFHNEVSVR
jgi:RNA polymerase sigma-70 factor, ECF subfamily